MEKKSLINFIILTTILFFTGFLSIQIYQLESRKRQLKKDLIELSDIKYGMFNVDKWKERISEILTKKLKELKLEGEERKIAKQKIIKFLYKVVDDFERNYKINNQRNSPFGISVKNEVVDFLDIFDEFRQNIPHIADQILDFLQKKENKKKIKKYILNQLDKYTQNTFQNMDYSYYNSILQKYGTDSGKTCKAKIKRKIHHIEKPLLANYLIFSGIFVIVILFLILIKSYKKLQIILLILIAFHFLLLGLLLPMIDIDARVGSMQFKLLGETIAFKNQVLYYQSKSILEMAHILLTQNKIKIILVGVLVLVFSILFPFFKLFFSILVLFKEKLQSNKFINFIVFKSGKWSMADVMVVAIFMSYIGFSGIISSQLAHLEQMTNKLHIITTNYSELQSGFFFFAGFVLMSIAISQIILNRFKNKITL